MTQESTAIIQLHMPTGGASDRRLKKDILPLSKSLKKVLSLKPVTWHWKDDNKKQGLQYGFIAQEVEKIFPAMVTEKKWDDGTDRKFLSTGEMIPYVVEAIKEQNETIVETSKQITDLLAILLKQQKEIDRLRTLIER